MKLAATNYVMLTLCIRICYYLVTVGSTQETVSFLLQADRKRETLYACIQSPLQTNSMNTNKQYLKSFTTRDGSVRCWGYFRDVSALFAQIPNFASRTFVILKKLKVFLARRGSVKLQQKNDKRKTHSLTFHGCHGLNVGFGPNKKLCNRSGPEGGCTRKTNIASSSSHGSILILKLLLNDTVVMFETRSTDEHSNGQE